MEKSKNSHWLGGIFGEMVRCRPFAEANSESIEPDYEKHKKEENFHSFEKSLLVTFIGMSFLLSIYKQGIFHSLGMMILIFLSLVGVFIGYLLVQKQLFIQSDYGDKICSMFKKSSCNDILYSSASKLLGVVGWSEIGLSYFTSCLILLSFFPHLLPYLMIVSICALPYSFWSVWYQKFKAQQWCPLCLIVQALFWCMFLIGLLFGFVRIPVWNASDIILVLSLFTIPLIVINTIVPKIKDARKLRNTAYEMNSLKTDPEVFHAILKNQAYYPVSNEDSHILFGNKEAKTVITVLTNPYCSPCATFHKRIDKLLDNMGEKICVQLIFTFFRSQKEDLEPTNHFLVSAYQNSTERESKQIFKEWYESGKVNKETFFSKYSFDVDNETVEKELTSHYHWSENQQLSATPTILLNGYKFPDNYKIEDLKYIL